MTEFLDIVTNTNKREHKVNEYTYIQKEQLYRKIQSFSHFDRPPPLAVEPAPRLYAPRWSWSAASSPPPPVLGGAPLSHPLDILGVLDPPSSAASKHCALPQVLLGAIGDAIQVFGAPPFAVLLTILAACEASLPAALQPPSNEPPIRIGLFGPGAGGVRRAVKAIHPDADRHLVDLYAVRSTPRHPEDDPLPRGVWPVLCHAYLPAEHAQGLTRIPLREQLARCSPEGQECWPSAAENTKSTQRHVLASIAADDAEAQHLPADVRCRVTALPFLMDRLSNLLNFFGSLDGAPSSIRRLDAPLRASFMDEMVEAASDLAMVTRLHLIAFYARIRPTHTTSVHRAAAAILRHRPNNISPTTLTSGVTVNDLRVLEGAGWVDRRDEETPCGNAPRFAPTRELVEVNIPKLPKKRPTRPFPVDIAFG